VIPSITLNSSDELIAFLRTHGSHAWYRGHSDDKQYTLTPGLLRPRDHGRPDHELLHNFMTRSSAFVGTPRSDDYSAWVSLAQHHGLPTRALDWSESFLTALFFAVCDAETEINRPSPSADAAVWLLDPKRLNSIYAPGTTGVFGEAELPVQLAHEFATLGQNAKSTSQLSGVFAYRPRYLNPRMAAQKAAFTWHVHDAPLEAHAAAHEFLRKILIPGRIKSELLKHVTVMGVSESTLFPDLEGVARELKRRIPRKGK
jgi:FRG domain